MRKSFFIIILLGFILSTNSIFAESWDDFANLDRAWDAQRTIDNKDYEDVVNALEEKKEKVEQKKKKKKFKSLFGRGGTTLHKELNPDKEVKDIPDLKPNKNGILINIPVDLYLDNHILERGYYNVIAKRNDEKKIYIKFYQSQYLKGEFPAEETQDDYGEATIDFARILPYNESFVKLIFGSIDFNAYAYIPYKE